MIIYEANVTLLLHGINSKQANSKKNQIENVQTVKGFAKIYSYG